MFDNLKFYIQIFLFISFTCFVKGENIAPINKMNELKDVNSKSMKKADLPPLMEFADGKPVRTMEDWNRRKEEIRKLILKTFIGTFPEKTPSIIKAETLKEIADVNNGSTKRQVMLYFDTPNKVSFNLWLWIPKGEGPFPVLLYAPCSDVISPPKLYNWPSIYKRFGWAEAALSRGYMVCLYPGVDNFCHEEGYEGYEKVYKDFHQAYPQATWTEISTKAWIAGRCLDYLLATENKYNIAKNQVCIIGWSRYGKQAMIAAAFDERITSVVSYSSSTPVPTPYRFAGRQTRMESPADTPDGWFLSSLKSYYGRENEMPVDGHAFYALIAPRRCLVHEAHNDGCGSTFAAERAYLEGKKVYTFLGHPENLRLDYRVGQHGPVTDEHRSRNIDWFDLSFGRGTIKQSDFPEQFIHQFDWDKWRAGLSQIDSQIPFNNKISQDDNERKIRILWALGQMPDKIEAFDNSKFFTKEESEMMGYDHWQVENTKRIAVNFGQNVRGNIYYNPSFKKPVPVIILLHPYSYHIGYCEGFGVEDYSSYKTGARGTTVYHWLAQQGYIVLAYDQCGFGLRLLEGRDFYANYPKWSRLGRMVYDVQSAVDFLLEGKGKSETQLPLIDRNKVFVLGYSMGGMVGLYAAALDNRITGVTSFCGFTPLRTDTDNKPTGGIRRLWQWHALQPLLGLFNNKENEIPYDLDDILALISPRPCLIVAPKHDRDANFEDVVNCLNVSGETWKKKGKAENLMFIMPDDINRFQAEQQDVFLDWYKSLGN